jgi:hypothetical protein
MFPSLPIAGTSVTESCRGEATVQEQVQSCQRNIGKNWTEGIFSREENGLANPYNRKSIETYFTHDRHCRHLDLIGISW